VTTTSLIVLAVLVVWRLQRRATLVDWPSPCSRAWLSDQRDRDSRIGMDGVSWNWAALREQDQRRRRL
jgi:hypothetical protein